MTGSIYRVAADLLHLIRNQKRELLNTPPSQKEFEQKAAISKTSISKIKVGWLMITSNETITNTEGTKLLDEVSL
jgi:hypothetical protein